MTQRSAEPNRLIHETSPYLLQHAYNPVNWYAWDDTITELAEKAGKPLLISIGYAACHWCHVMENESFEDKAVARIMNEHFICVKVDREERPDIDQLYMTAVQLLTGSGGWPLNCFALPDGKPFFGGTYFPRDNWMNLLQTLSHYYQHEKEKILDNARQIEAGLIKNEQLKYQVQPSGIEKEKLDRFVSNLKHVVDFEHGGTLGAPKFPMPGHYEFLLSYYYHTADTDSLRYTELSLQQMAKGGIYDHLGGGFSRYSTDVNWKVPHFEKMLYDNAQLLSVYSKLYKMEPRGIYKKVISETAGFLQNELAHPGGGFYSSIDADSEGAEGKYYTWHTGELKQLLSKKEFAVFRDYYSISETGNWEHGMNILHRHEDENKLADRHNLSINELKDIISGCNRKLLEIRSTRKKPLTDDKMLTAWNALTIRGLCDAYTALGNSGYLQMAMQTGEFMVNHMLDSPGSLYRTHKNGKSKINGFLDDYAFTIESFIELYQLSFDEKWIKLAKTLTEHCLSNYYDEESGLFWYNSRSDNYIVINQKDLSDNVIPSSNSTMALNLLRMSRYYGLPEYENISKNMLEKVLDDGIRKPSFHYKWGNLLIHFYFGSKEMVITGPNYASARHVMLSRFHPEIIAVGGGTEESIVPLLYGKTDESNDTLYICENHVCNSPVKTTGEALKMLRIESR